MTEALGEADVAVSLMKEALTMLDAPEAAPAARLLQMAIDAASDIGASDADDSPNGARDAAEAGE